MKQSFTASLWKEGDWYIAQCREVDVASQGETEQEAMRNLAEALRLHMKPPKATILPRLAHVEVDVDAA